MVSRIARVTVGLCLIASAARAQSVQFTVGHEAAPVYQGPSTGAPVVGTARRGAVLTVSRELGDWVKVSWPEARDGFGYVRVSLGSVSHTSTGPSVPAPPAPAAASATATTPSDGAIVPSGSIMVLQPDPRTMRRPTHSSSHSQYIATPTHIVGLGGRVNGSTVGYGLTGRVWAHKGLGVQLEVSRYTLTNPGVPDRMTSVQFAPSVLYAFHDAVTDYVWLRPYVGGGGRSMRSTLNSDIASESPSDTSFAPQVFGGVELTFANVPRFAVSGDVGYNRSHTPFAGLELGGVNFSVSGHWYLR